MSLLDSPLSSVQLRQHPQRFETVVGLRVDEFDALCEKVYEADRAQQQARHGLWTPDRIDRLVQKYRPGLREYLCVPLLYLRQYPIQEV